ncbi:MAG TPA: MBL fold metallo-hydrolase [Kiritimatiellia bacterium]|nr:MBL fold metallo-hydrolase [Kiritimatiellia bacterium]
MTTDYPARTTMTINLHFHGGADTVTGSMHLIEVNGARVLRDAGLFQGRREDARRINRSFGFNPGDINAVLLSHAHIDHCGNLPSLCAQGYRNPIHATAATARIAEVMLRDSAQIQMQDAAYLNQKTNRKGQPAIDPLYTLADAEQAISLLRGHAYHQPVALAPGIRSTAYEAGHILGAELSYLELNDGRKTVKLGFAVDLGRHHLPLIRDPEVMPPVDVLVLESTYGNRLHGPAENARDQLRAVITRTWAGGGKVLIPAFALERAQELIYHISSMMIDGELEKRPVYLDSPMAAAVTRIFDQHADYLDEEYHAMREKMTCLMCPPWVKVAATPDESRRITAAREPCVVIAASGMCEHGRILHHLKHGIENPANTVVIVGYQAVHTLGRRLVEGQKEVRIFGDMFDRNASVDVLDAFSAHADRKDLIACAAQSGARAVYLVHGEEDAREALAEALRTELAVKVYLPRRGETAELT